MKMGQSGGLCEQMFNMQMRQSGVFVFLIGYLEVYFSLYVLHGLDLLSVKKEEKAKHHHLLVCCSLYLGVHCYVTYQYTQYLGTQSRACVFVFIIAFSLARLVGLLIGT